MFHKRVRQAALMVLLALPIVFSLVPPARAGTGFASAFAEEYCRGSDSSAVSMQFANELLANRYTLPPHPTVTLPANPTWREDPLRDNNWKFQFHALRYVRYLVNAWRLTADARYRDRASFLLADWLRDNPRSAPASVWAWNDHSTAWRATIYACAFDPLGKPSWGGNAMLLHGRVLADPNFYVYHGNHALNQNIGLLDVGCRLGRTDWTSLARDRLGRLIVESIDSQGVTNEQAPEYQYYNYSRYMAARRRLEACASVPLSFSRLTRMPPFMAYATLPNGRYELIGDTKEMDAPVVRGTIAEYAATAGASGPKPPSTLAVYSAGFAFGRSGWGEHRPFRDEVAWSVRYGPRRIYHGHLDAGALTLFGYGSRLLMDSGKYTFNPGPYRTYFGGRSAHNVITVDGVPYDTSRASYRSALRTSATHYEIGVRHNGYPGVTSVRRVIFSRRLNYLLVYDQLLSSTTHRYRQLWHLREDANPSVISGVVRTQRARGNVLIRQLYGTSSVRIVRGATNPIQGWLSYTLGIRLANPTVEYVKSGASTRYLTLLVPDADGKFYVSIKALNVRSDGFTVLLTVNGHAERVTLTPTSSSIAVVS
jgi:heparinase II/III-like protein